MKTNIGVRRCYYNGIAKECNLNQKPCWKYGTQFEQCDVVSAFEQRRIKRMTEMQEMRSMTQRNKTFWQKIKSFIFRN